MAHAGTLRVCVAPESQVNKDIRNGIRQELSLYETWLGSKIEFSCEAAGAVSVLVTGRAGWGMQPDALGATRVAGGFVQPEIVIFRDAIRNMLPVEMRLEGNEVRAMARVIAHELRHFLSGTGSHQVNGVDDEQLSAGHLLSRPPRIRK